MFFKNGRQISSRVEEFISRIKLNHENLKQSDLDIIEESFKEGYRIAVYDTTLACSSILNSYPFSVIKRKFDEIQDKALDRTFNGDYEEFMNKIVNNDEEK